MIIAGLDPSLSNFGMAKGELTENKYFTLTDLLLTETKPEKKNKQLRVNTVDLGRARLLHRSMEEFLEGVDLVSIEIPVGSQSARSMASYGICVGIISSIKIPILQVTPTEVKMAATGNKNATKKEMIEWATNEFPGADWLYKTQKGQRSLTDKNEHLADAVAAIRAGVQSETFQQLLTFQQGIPS